VRVMEKFLDQNVGAVCSRHWVYRAKMSNTHFTMADDRLTRVKPGWFIHVEHELNIESPRYPNALGQSERSSENAVRSWLADDHEKLSPSC
jgi:hypothetical protein